ncbi:MAG: LysM peptidoglycan-binding domain-containing protein [Rhodospirillaceae bacterium]|nr:LysM peptidoglycan-binding domain-containing protein [Rhodospirillaceae bacterium]
MRKSPDRPAAKAPVTVSTPGQDDKLSAPALGGSPDTRNGKVVVTRKNHEKAASQNAKPEQVAPKKIVAADKAGAVMKPPTFDIVRIAKDRTAVVAGRGPPGSTMRLSLNGKILAETPVSNNGEWVAVISQPLPYGNAELDLVAVLPDHKFIAAEAIVAVVIPEATSGKAASTTKVAKKKTQTALAVLLPKSGDAPVKLLQRPKPKKDAPAANKLSVDTVDYDDKGNVVVAGSAPSGVKVRTYVDNKPVGISQADKKSTWQLKPESEVAPGSHTLRVDQVDDAGRVVSRVELPFVRVSAAEILATTTARIRVIVQPGNSLWRIARRTYGGGERYTVIYQANADQIRNPDMIFPGQVFNLPTEN